MPDEFSILSMMCPDTSQKCKCVNIIDALNSGKSIIRLHSRVPACFMILSRKVGGSNEEIKM